MEQFKKRVDVYGWTGCFVAVGLLWLVCLWKPLHEYFIPVGGIELAKLVGVFLGTCLIWSLYVMTKGRDWQEYGREERQWQADHDLAMIDEMNKLHISKLQDVTNIIGDGTGAPSISSKGIGVD